MVFLYPFNESIFKKIMAHDSSVLVTRPALCSSFNEPFNPFSALLSSLTTCLCLQVLYHLHCENLCSDFQEDLRFRFSMGLASMIQRFLGGGGRPSSSAARRAATQTAPDSADVSSMGVPRGLKAMASHSPVTPTNEFFVPQDDWSLVSKVAVASLTSQVRLSFYTQLSYIFVLS